MDPPPRCRMCARIAIPAVPLLDPSQHALQWAIKDMDIKITNGLTTNVCLPCVDHLNKWVKFLEGCETNYESLKNATTSSHPNKLTDFCETIPKINESDNENQLLEFSDNKKYSLTELKKKINIKDVSVKVNKLSQEKIDELTKVKTSNTTEDTNEEQNCEKTTDVDTNIIEKETDQINNLSDTLAGNSLRAVSCSQLNGLF